MDYNGINAKVGGMFGRLLTHADYERLSRLRTVEEIGLFLKTLPAYQQLLTGAESHRIAIERRLVLSLYDDFHRLYSFINDDGLKRFLDCHAMKHEVAVIKELLCLVYDERDTSGVTTGTLPQHVRLDIGRLRAARSVSELIDGLKGTEFYPVLARVYAEGQSLFELEVQLDLYYYRRLREGVEKYLDHANARLFDEIIGVETDLRNIMWICRLKTSYPIDRDLLYTYLIPSVHKLTRAQLNTLVTAESQEALMTAIAAGPYGRSFSAERMQADGFRLEHAYDNAIGRMYASARRKYPHTLAPTAAYLYFKEREINNITSILEGVRYGLKPEEIMRFVTSYYGMRNAYAGGSHG